MTSDPVVRIDGHACPRRKQERPAVVSTASDTVGKGDRCEQAGEVEIGRSGVGSTEAAFPPAGGVTGEPQCLRICVVAASAEQGIEPKSEIDRSASPSEQIAIGERRSEKTGGCDGARVRRFEFDAAGQQVSETRVGPETMGVTAMAGKTMFGIEEFEVGEEGPRLTERRRRGCIEPGQLVDVGCAPSGDVERQRAEVGGGDLRRFVGRTVGIVGGMPEAHAGAGLLPTGTPGSLVGRCSAGGDGAEHTHAASVIDLGSSALAGVDHRGHTVDRHAGFGEWSCQHDLAPAVRVASQRRVLVIAAQRAMEWHHDELVIETAAKSPTHGPFDTSNGTDPREEDEQITGVGIRADCVDNGGGRCVGEILARLGRAIADRDRVTFGLDLHDGVGAESGSQRFGVEGGRHDHDPQIRAQGAHGLAKEGQGGVGVYRPFVELVEEHDRIALECRIVEQHAGEHALGDDLDTGDRGHPCVVAGAQADGVAHLLTAFFGHPSGRRSGGDPPGLQHEHPAFTDPWLLDERRWDARGLAGAGRRLHDDETLVVERSVKLGKRAVDGERHVGGFAQFSASSSAITVATASATDSGWLRITKWRAPSTVVR